MTFQYKATCDCGRVEKCGLVTGKLDDLDIQGIWLPVRYLNYIRGASFLETKKDEKAKFDSRRSAVQAYLKEMGAG